MSEMIPFLNDYLPDFKVSGPDIQMQLSAFINELILNDFQKLLNLLYRLDINELKLQMLLNDQGHQTAGDIIAAMIINRQQQKIDSRKKYRSDKPSDEERW